MNGLKRAVRRDDDSYETASDAQSGQGRAAMEKVELVGAEVDAERVRAERAEQRIERLISELQTANANLARRVAEIELLRTQVATLRALSYKDKEQQEQSAEAFDEAEMLPVVLEQPRTRPHLRNVWGFLQWLSERRAIRRDVRILRGSELFDAAWYLRQNEDIARSGVDPLYHYVRHGAFEGRDPSPGFSSSWYLLRYDDVRQAGFNPLVHYLLYGKRNGRHPLPLDGKAWRLAFPPAMSGPHAVGSRDANGEQIRQARIIEPRFDRQYYRANAGLRDDTIDEIEHYLTIGRYCGFNPSRDFSLEYYTARYPDVVRAGMDPFVHFVSRGIAEGRLGRPNFRKRAIAGGQKFDPEKKTIVVVSHDASRSGAPLVGLELAHCLSKSFNMITCTGPMAGRGGELVPEFASVSVLTFVDIDKYVDAEYLLPHLRDEYGASAVVLNSVETASFASAALHCELPSVALVHEFAEYTFPPGKMAAVVAATDRVIVPAEIVLESVQREVAREFGGPANNLTVRPQGSLPQLPQNSEGDDLTAPEILLRLNAADGKKPAIVLGAGFFHMRKGIELFVQTAAEVRRQMGDDIRFVWVGDGYDPKGDSRYSVWLSEAAKRLDLEHVVSFFPPQGNLNAFFELTDVFFLSSRLDPFPNVVLDALKAGKSVVCFERATGAAELFTSGTARGAAVAYCDVKEAADAIVALLRSDQRENAEINRALVARSFQFPDYGAYIKREIHTARQLRTELEHIFDRLIASGAFDADFHEGKVVSRRGADNACWDYVARSVKGLRKFNPRPGFSDGYYRSRHRLKPGEVPLDHALRTSKDKNAPAFTHRCVVLNPRESQRTFLGRIALHVHLHYSDLASEFLDRLHVSQQPIDLFITTTSADIRDELERSFASYDHGTVDVLQVPNRGRDIGPLLTQLKDRLSTGGYDVVGHLHGKRSLTLNAGVGDRWRTYLLDTLLGGGFSQLINLFTDEQQLGLVFAEDRHSVGWDANREIAEELARRMNLKVRLPDFPAHFPLGTMFWARPAAIAPLWRLGLQTGDLPKEPLVTDGTILHAIERMLPTICEAADLSWCTVYDKMKSW
jgi:glycosyltransferase involved in cell wall biosynthesis